MENVRNRVDIKLGEEEFALKQSKKQNFKNFCIFYENCIASHMYEQKVKLDLPNYARFSVLDHPKLLMCEFYYDKHKKYDPDLNLLYMDTDSYFVEMRKDPYKVIKEHSLKFDTRDYDNDHEWYDVTNKKVIGIFKDELNVKPLEEYCGL